MDAQRLKHLQVRKQQLRQELDDLIKALRDIQDQIQRRTNTLHEIEKCIEDSMHKPVVSEHATLRYIERILKIDLEKIEADILSEENKKVIDQVSSCKIPFKNDYLLIVRNKTVTTITEKDE
jgi:hypothetical protein